MPISLQLAPFVATLNFHLTFCRFSLDLPHGAVWVDWALLGDQVSDEELRFTIRIVAQARVRIAFGCYRAIGRLARALPTRTVAAVAAVLGEAGTLLLRRRRRVVARHLRRVLGVGVNRRALIEAVHRAFRSYALYWLGP